MAQFIIRINSRKFVQVGWILFLIAWAVTQAWGNRFFEHYNDGVSYLDMADYFRRGDFADGFSCHWNFLYPAVIAFIFNIIKPSAYYEFAALKLVNLIIFLSLLFAFAYFLKILLKFYKEQMSKETGMLLLSETRWIFLAYALFSYAFLCLNGIAMDTPDMLMAALMFMAITYALKILSGEATFKNHALFGGFAGMAYLAKSAALPIALVCLPLFCWQRNKIDRFWPKLAVTAIALTVISLPHIAYLSKKAGELTVSTAGKLNYIWFVQEHNASLHVQGNQSLRQSLLHPTRQIFTKPDVFEFTQPVNGTYPPWFDPYYWFQGCQTHPCWHWLALTGECSLIYYGLIFFAPLITVAILIWLINGKRIVSTASLAANSILLIPALTGFWQYAFVINLLVVFRPFINRYFGLFIVLLALGFLASLRLKDDQRGILALKLGAIAACLFLAVPMAKQLASDVEMARQNQRFEHYLVAQELEKRGLLPGDYVARIGEEERFVDWARLSRLKIVADIPDDKEFWSISKEKRQDILQVLKKYNVKMVVYFSAPITTKSYLWWQFNHQSLPARLNIDEAISPEVERSTEGTQTLSTNIINPPPLEGWQQIDNLPCWVHRID